MQTCLPCSKSTNSKCLLPCNCCESPRGSAVGKGLPSGHRISCKLPSWTVLTARADRKCSITSGRTPIVAFLPNSWPGSRLASFCKKASTLGNCYLLGKKLLTDRSLEVWERVERVRKVTYSKRFRVAMGSSTWKQSLRPLPQKFRKHASSMVLRSPIRTDTTSFLQSNCLLKKSKKPSRNSAGAFLVISKATLLISL